MTEAIKARPRTKMLDLDSLPKLEAPTHPFQRLRAPLQIPRSLESDEEKGKGSKRKRKRPLPGQKWRKRISHEETLLEESGTFNNFHHLLCLRIAWVRYFSVPYELLAYFQLFIHCLFTAVHT